MRADVVTVRNSGRPDHLLVIPVARWESFVHELKEGLIRYKR